MSISWVASTTNILWIVSDLEQYKAWLSKFHGINLENNQSLADNIFLGYKFFFDVGFRALIEDLDSYPWFNGNDEIFMRAWTRGVYLDEIPNSSEYVVFLKNLWYKNLEKVLLAKNWESLEKRLKYFRKNVLSRFFKVLECCITPKSPFTRDQLYRLWAMDDALVRYVDSQMGHPKAYIDILIPTTSKYYRNNKNYLVSVFQGYVYTLQYLWYSILDKEQFLRIPHLNEMHIADKVFGKEVLRELGGWLPEEEFKIRQTEFERYIKWKSLDRFFGILNMHLVRKLEKEYGIRISPSNGEIFELHCKCNPREILKKFYSTPFPEPNFMSLSNNPDKTMNYEDWKKYLNVKFLWYPLDVLSSGAGGTFNGAAALIYLLSGICEFKKEHGIKDPTRVLRIKHREYFEDKLIGHRISYALLVEAFGELYSHPGWIVFYDVGTDFSGTGGSWYYSVEEVIKKYHQMLKIDEIIVPEMIFRKYLVDESIREVSKEHLQIEELKKKVLSCENLLKGTEEALSVCRGLLPELIVYLLINSEELPIKTLKNVKWRAKVRGEEIDVLAIDEIGRPHVFECKFDVHKEEFESIVQQLERKKMAIRDAYKKLPVLYLIFLFNKNNYDLTPLTKHDINVITLERELRKYLGIGTIDKLLNMNKTSLD
ncbi:hypothetical protein A3L09_00465 [Thermococcus profundus]|uniref:Uncharacterized protein n=2 Tax=Thermococcus profundus TaxID=49899 RepID=A0A2Z2M6R9_THEPR|nr:hypothetical protein A3L09_00465 [Thermococcus profundus]